MTRIIRILTVLLLPATLVVQVACHPNTPPVAGLQAQEDSLPEESAFSNTAPETDGPIYLDENNQMVAGAEALLPEDEPRRATPTPRAATHSSPLPQGKMYVHGYGAQGEVWGTVTMQGNTGRGSIHDADENTLSIRVSRRGNELLGTDQNGREYVFKLQ